MKHLKRMLWVIPLGFVVLGLIGQLLISTGTIEEQKAGENPKPTITIAPKPSIKPKDNPLDSWKKYNVNWNEYGDGMQELLAEHYIDKDCYTLQGFFDLTVQDNDDHKAKFGHNNVNLMRYVDHLLEAANCYK